MFLPVLRYETYDGEQKILRGPLEKPLLINLWATWCPSCLVELTDFREHQQAIQGAGLEILALSADRQKGDSDIHRDNARNMMKKLRFPFRQGMIGSRFIEKIQLLIQNQNFDSHLLLPMPTSILLDTNGDLAAIYRGPVTAKQLLDDVKKLDLKDEDLLAASTPFPGIWRAPPGRMRRILPIATTLIDIDLLEDAVDFIQRHESEFSEDLAYPELLSKIAVEFAERGNPQGAEVQYRALLQANPDHAPSLYNLAILLKNRGEFKEAGQLLQRAAQVQPDFVNAHTALGVILEREGKFDGAMAEFSEALRLKPNHATAHLNVALLLKRKGEYKESRIHLEQAVRFRPDFIPALLQLGLRYGEDGDSTNAMAQFQEILKHDPQHTMALYQLGYLLQQEGRVKEAIAHYRKASRGNPEFLELYNNLAWLLATAPDQEDRNGEDAIRYALFGVKATNYEEAVCLDTLAAAYAESGQFPKAIELAEKGVQAARAKQQDDLVERIEKRLRLYQNGQPFHE